MISNIIAMIVFVFTGSIAPGPVNIIATGSSANFGLRKSIPHVFGATLSYTCIVILMGTGLNSIIIRFPVITEVLKYAGAAFLFYISFKLATTKPELKDEELNTPPKMLHGMLCQAFNPMAWLVSISGISVFVSSQSSPLVYLLIFIIISFTFCFIGVGLWALLGKIVGEKLTDYKKIRVFNITLGVLITLSVVYAIFIS